MKGEKCTTCGYTPTPELIATKELRETQRDILRKQHLRNKLKDLSSQISELEEEIKESELKFPKNIERELKELFEKEGKLRWNWWDHKGTSIFQITTPNELSAVVKHFLDSGMKVMGLDSYYNSKINLIQFTWK